MGVCLQDKSQKFHKFEKFLFDAKKFKPLNFRSIRFFLFRKFYKTIKYFDNLKTCDTSPKSNPLFKINEYNFQCKMRRMNVKNFFKVYKIVVNSMTSSCESFLLHLFIQCVMKKKFRSRTFRVNEI